MSGMDRIRELLAAATPGPWRWDENYGDNGDTGLALTNDAGVEIVGAYNHHCCAFRDDPNIENESDAAFIAAAPSIVAQLLAKIEAMAALADKIDAAFTTDHSVDVQMRATAYQIRSAINGETAT